MIHVLIVEDEPSLQRALTMNLSSRGYSVSAAASGRAALHRFHEAGLDLMLLDLGLPDMDGMDVIREVRRTNATLPIIVLSARTGSDEKVTALDLGANDYVTKPFDMAEVLARIRAASRGAQLVEAPEPVELERVVIDLGARSVRLVDRAGESVRLTPTEWRMVELLLRRPGALVTTTELLTAMRGDAEHTERSYLRIYMSQLRRKLEADPSRPRHFITETGLGYRFVT